MAAAPPASAPQAPAAPPASTLPAITPLTFTLPDRASPASLEYTPSMEWLLSGPALPMLGEEEDFLVALAPPPPPLYCPIHGHGPCPTRDGTAPRPPSPTLPATPPGIDVNTTAGDDLEDG
ncbi:forkhead box protein I3-like [Brachypodium distachyon]|uniref:forkhead box protein I3-like n=1 Tax=Brachypodium distachyon TaxID=15368 RepID=UPI0005300208|nr:forkhead box protein I3-like [Brachypodium distachyon]|eukprot:XP_010229926.1 forkhead box protein I3-like [Brachypodium distachyon]